MFLHYFRKLKQKNVNNQAYQTVFFSDIDANNNYDINDMIERVLLNILSAHDDSFSQFTKIAEREEITELKRFYHLELLLTLKLKLWLRKKMIYLQLFLEKSFHLKYFKCLRRCL